MNRFDSERYQQWRNAGGARQLEGLALLGGAALASYEPRNEVIPDQQHASIAPAATWDHRVKVPPGSYLWAISGSSAQLSGFTLQITDVSTRTNLFSGAIKSKTLFGGTSLNYLDCNKATRQVKTPLALVSPPRPLVGSGILNVQITNLDVSNANAVQVVLWILRPTLSGTPNEQNQALAREIADWQGRSTYDAKAASGDRSMVDPSMARPATNRPFSISATGGNILIPAVPGRRIAIHEFSAWNTVEQNIRIQDGTQDLVGQLLDYPANAFYYLPYQDEPHFILTDGNAFNIDLSAISGGSVGAMNGYVRYRLFQPDFTALGQ